MFANLIKDAIGNDDDNLLGNLDNLEDEEQAQSIDEQVFKNLIKSQKKFNENIVTERCK